VNPELHRNQVFGRIYLLFKLNSVAGTLLYDFPITGLKSYGLNMRHLANYQAHIKLLQCSCQLNLQGYFPCWECQFNVKLSSANIRPRIPIHISSGNHGYQRSSNRQFVVEIIRVRRGSSFHVQCTLPPHRLGADNMCNSICSRVRCPAADRAFGK
jgi:hypothetical protein